MPIYEYQCQDCGHQLEAIRKFSDPPLEECPECGKPSLKKLVSAPSFRLKGGGWYETDFKSGDKKKNLAGDSDASGTPASTGSGGSGDSGGAGDKGKDKGKKETTSSPDKSDSSKKSADSSKSDSKPSSAGKSSSKNQAA